MAADNETKTVAQRIGSVIYRIGVIVVIAFSIGLILNKISSHFEGDTRPAGLLRGMLQGALMPMSMPNLLVGKDVSIYSPHNTGTTYKLGYTLGTNTCGAIFFGLFFWRVTRWRSQQKR
jgi:hypothetical protein